MMSEGPEAYVSTAMDRNPPRVSVNSDLTAAFERLSAAGTCALVMDEDDRLVGILTAENVSEFLLLRQASLAQARAETR
jgi:CBS domain-containing protein